MVEADSHLKLLPTSTLDIYKVFEHIAMLFIVIKDEAAELLLAGCCLTPLLQTCQSIPCRSSISPPPCRHRHTPRPCRRPRHVMVDALVTQLPPTFAADCHPLSSCSLRWLLLAFTALLSMVGCCVRACFALCSLSPAFNIASGEFFATSRHPLLPPIASHLSSCSHCWPLVFATLPSMVGCCVHACFAILLSFRHPPPALIISCRCAGINAFVTACHPLLPPITSHSPLALIASH
jgi:hypothetical protein